MKKKTALSLVAVCAALAMQAHAGTGSQFVREKAGSIWQDGLFIGDGSMAALAYAPAHLEWMLNKNDLYDARVKTCEYMPHDKVMEKVAASKGKSVSFLTKEYATMHGEVDRLSSSMSAAILRIRFWGGVGWSAPSVPATRQVLDWEKGELVERMTSPFMRPEALSLVERSRDVMAVRLSDALSKSRKSVVEIARPEDPRLSDAGFSWTTNNGLISFTQKLPFGDSYAVAMSAPGTISTMGRTGRTSVDGEGTLFIAVRTSREAADPEAAAREAVKAAEKDGFDKVRADNAAWWRDFWSRGARARFTSAPAIDRQWHYSLYALASQFGKAPMPPLNGLSYGPIDGGTPGVGSNCYVHDQNVQIPMMPFFPLNHCEFVRTFVETYEKAAPLMRRQTRERFGAGGIYLPLNMNLDGVEHPIAHYRYTLCGGAYSGLILVQAWRYSRDRELLKSVYPLLKEFIKFYTDTMTRDDKGGYHFIWSVPPEIFTGTKDELAIVACLKPCLETAVEAAEIFKCDADEAALWRDVLAHYPKCARQSEGGWWGGPEIPDDHYMYGGHLFYPFFPAESDLDRETAAKTLDYTWKYAVEISHSTREPHPAHEWSALYTGIATTRLYGKAKGWKTVTDFFANFAKPNGLFAHNPIVVTDLTREEAIANSKRLPKLMRRGSDGEIHEYGRMAPNDLTYNADAKALVAPVLEGGAAFLMLSSEALLQSWGGEIRLFPSVPKTFTGRFENFLAQGGYRVSAEMENGRLVDFRVEGLDEKGPHPKITCPTDPSFVLLPGEPCWKKPLAPAAFGDDVLSAYVWRNWGLVSKNVLAETIGATPEEITAIAEEMGLDPSPKVSPAWRRKGVVTILRRNWHLLPYPQLMKLVDMTRDELRYQLLENDFLYSKLGSLKPACSMLEYSAAEAEKGHKSRTEFREILKADGVAVRDSAEEPRFAFLDELAAIDSGTNAAASAGGTDARFDLRMIYSYCSEYGDPLADKNVSSCPEGLVQKLAARGINAIWFHVVLSTLTTDPKYPEFGQDSKARVASLRKLVARAAKYGVKIYLYINEPRAQPAAFFEKPGRAEMRGSPDRRAVASYSMCTRHPATLEWLRGALKQLFTKVPGLGGVFTITMSENQTHCASSFKIGCERCKGHGYPEFIIDINKAIYEGVKAGNKDAEVCFFDTAWPDNASETVVPYLPKGGRLIAWSEKLKPFKQAGLDLKVSEYSIAQPGPGPRAVKLWNAAHAAGLKTAAKLQVSTTWEICAVPYLPAMDLVAEHAFNLSTSAVDGVMLSWSLGGYPSPNLALFDEFRKGEKDVGSLLDRFAAKLYGPAAPAARKAWTAFSRGFAEYPILWQTVYYSPVQMGPANPLYAEKTGYNATMVNIPYDDIERWTEGYKANRPAWIEQMRKCSAGFAEGVKLWNDVVAASGTGAKAAVKREGAMFAAAALHFRTCVDQAEFILARDRGDRAAMLAAAERDLATAKEFLPIVRADSRVGYESSNNYMYVPNDVLEKIVNCRIILRSSTPASK